MTWTLQRHPRRAADHRAAKEPERQARGALLLTYKIEDDYGVVEAQATFERKDAPAAADKPARPLFDAPNFPLVLPQARTRSGVGQTTKDLTEHPWAGADVDHDADRPRRGRQRGPQRARASCGCRNGRSSRRWRAR